MLGEFVSRFIRALVSAGLAGSVMLSGAGMAVPANAVSSYPCGAEFSSTVGTLQSLTLPSSAVAGDDLPIAVTIRCEGDRQAVLVAAHLTFENDQGISRNVSVTESGIRAGDSDGSSTVYTVSVPTADGALPEGLQRLTGVTLVMEKVPQFRTGSMQPRYSRSIYHPYLSLHRPAGWEVRIGHPTHAAPTPQVPWAFTADAPAEVRFPAWGKGARLSYRWFLEDGTAVADGRDYVPAPGSLSRLEVTGTWPDGTVHIRSSRLVRTVDTGGGFNDVTVVGEAVPYGGAVRAVRTSPVHGSSSSGWYRVRSDGSFPSTRETPYDAWYPKAADVGQRFQFIEAGSRNRGASPIVTVGPAPLPEDRRSGYLQGDSLVNHVADLQPDLQPGYRLTANNPWPAGQKVSYAWLRNGKVIPGATGPAYTLRVSDAGSTLQAVTRTASPGYASNEAKAGPVKVPLVKLKSAKPLVSGAARVGVTLRASTPGWTAGTKFSYQWLRNGKPIPGAARSAYTVPAKDRSTVLQVRVTGTQPYYTTVSGRSAENLINYGILTAPAPRITGTAKAGRTLTAQAGAWTPGTTLRYQWYRNNQPITGATRSTYRVAAVDRGKAVKVRVQGIKAGYTGQFRTSGQKRIPY